MSDPSIDPTLARPLQATTQDVSHLLQPDGVPSNDIFNETFEEGPNPAAYQLAAQGLQNAHPGTLSGRDGTDVQRSKKDAKSKKTGTLIRKRSGWNAFYKEQFAIYHANNPPATKQNARERSGFSSYAAQMWKQLSPAQKETYVQRAGEDDALAVSRPVEKLRRRRAGLLETLGRVVAELETEFGVDSLFFWSERDTPSIQPDGSLPIHAEGESYGIVGSSTGSRFIEVMSNANLGPQEFMMFIQQTHPPDAGDAQQNLQIGTRKRNHSVGEEIKADLSGVSVGEIDLIGQLKKKTRQSISRDYHDAEFRRLLLALLNNNLPPQSQKTRLPRGFFGPYLEKHGLELVGLPEKPVEIGEGGKIGGWSAEALRKNLEAVRSNRVYIQRVGLQAGESNPVDLMDVTIQTMEDEAEAEEMRVQEDVGGVQEEEAVRILAEGAGKRRGGRRGGTKQT